MQCQPIDIFNIAGLTLSITFWCIGVAFWIASERTRRRMRKAAEK